VITMRTRFGNVELTPPLDLTTADNHLIVIDESGEVLVTDPDGTERRVRIYEVTAPHE